MTPVVTSFSSFAPEKKKFEQKSLVSGWSPFTLLNRKVCRGGANRAANSACMICGIRIQIQHPSESDDQINKLGEKQTANSCSILFIESILLIKNFLQTAEGRIFRGNMLYIDKSFQTYFSLRLLSAHNLLNDEHCSGLSCYCTQHFLVGVSVPRPVG